MNTLRQLSELTDQFSEVASEEIDRSSFKGNYFKTAKCKLQLTAKIYSMSISGPDNVYSKNIQLAEIFADWADATNATNAIIKNMPNNRVNPETANALRKLKANKFANIIEKSFSLK
jgi:hypothetical protein